MPVDRNKYPDDWEEISCRIRFERACGFCECDGECGTHSDRCDAAHGWPHPVTGSEVVLTTAHLDHDTTHNDDDNLKAMCQRCHNAYDVPFRRRNRARRARQEMIEAGQLWLI